MKTEKIIKIVKPFTPLSRQGAFILLIELLVLVFLAGVLVGILWMGAPVIHWKYLPVDKFNYSLWSWWLLRPESWIL